MASKFEKRNTIVELEIEVNTWTVDMAEDRVGLALTTATMEIGAIQKAAGMTAKDAEKSMEKMKVAYEKGINAILDDPEASKKIFVEDSSVSYHDDIFLFIQSEFERVANEKLSKYSAARALR